MSSLTKKAQKEFSFFKRFFLLVGFKQAYFFLKNLWGMVIHPQLTTAKILGQKDFPQAFLVFGLPFNLWLFLLLSSFIIWFLARPTGWLFKLGAAFFFLSGFFLLVLALYYLYWAVRYLRKTNGLSISKK